MSDGVDLKKLMVDAYYHLKKQDKYVMRYREACRTAGNEVRLELHAKLKEKGNLSVDDLKEAHEAFGSKLRMILSRG